MPSPMRSLNVALCLRAAMHGTSLLSATAALVTTPLAGQLRANDELYNKIVELLESPDKQARTTGLQMASVHGTIRLAPKLMPLLDDEDPALRNQAIAALASQSALEPTVERLEEEPRLAGPAATFFTAIGAKGAPHLSRMLASQSSHLRIAALRALAQRRTPGSDSVEELLAIAEDGTAVESSTAIRALIAAGRSGCIALAELSASRLTRLAPHVRSLLNHRDPLVRQKMWPLMARDHTLKNLAKKFLVPGKPRLFGNAATRRGVLDFLGHCEYSSDNAPGFDRLLIDGLLDPVPDVRRSALGAAAACQATGPLHLGSRLVRDEHATVRMQSATTLASFGRRASSYRPAIERLRKDPDPRVRKAARNALEKLSRLR